MYVATHDTRAAKPGHADSVGWRDGRVLQQTLDITRTDFRAGGRQGTVVAAISRMDQLAHAFRRGYRRTTRGDGVFTMAMGNALRRSR